MYTEFHCDFPILISLLIEKSGNHGETLCILQYGKN